MGNYALAEMASTADYSAMNYGEILATKNAFNWAIGNNINPLLPAKRLEEMSKITHIYVTVMNSYCATKTEILDCLEKEDLRSNPMFSTDYVDEQDAAAISPAEMKDNQTMGEELIAIPESPVSIQDDIDVNAHMAALLESASKSEEVDVADSMTSYYEEEISALPEYKKEEPVDVDIPEIEEQANTMAVEWAIEKAKTCKIPEEINISASYHVEYTFGYDVLNGPVLRRSNGRNMMNERLVALKDVEKKYVEYYRRATNIISSDDCLAYTTPFDEIIVVMYHLEKESCYVEEEATSSATDNNGLSDDEQKAKKKISVLKRAIKKAMDQSAEDKSEANTYYNDRYSYGMKSCSSFYCRSNTRHYVNDVDTLVDMKAVLEAYAKLAFDNPKIVSTDNCLAVMPGDYNIYVAIYNIPAPKKTKRSKKVRKDNVAPVVETKAVEPAPVEDEDPLIKEAVELAMSSPVPNGIDASGSYFIQHTFDVMKDGELVSKGKPFGDNVDTDMLENTKMRHMKYASTMKGSHITSTKDYTAYIELGGNRVNVYLYHTSGTKNND